MSNILLILMGVFLLIPSLIYQQYFLSLTFIIFALVFGLVEYAANFYTGMTVTNQLQALLVEHSYKAITILGCMLMGWICLLLHLGIRFKK